MKTRFQNYFSVTVLVIISEIKVFVVLVCPKSSQAGRSLISISIDFFHLKRSEVKFKRLEVLGQRQRNVLDQAK